MALACSLGSISFSALADEFPEGVKTPSAAELNGLMKGKTFNVKLPEGLGWKLDYRDNGYFYVNVSNGFNGSGRWSVEDGKMCSNVKTDPTVCNDMRIDGTRLLLKRSNGTIVHLEPAI